MLILSKKILFTIFTILIISSCSKTEIKESTREESSRDNLYQVDEKKHNEVVRDSINLEFKSVIEELESKLSDDFTIKQHMYYVVVSDLSEEKTNQLINHTITATTECLYNDYFEKRPTEVTTIFLFGGDRSYRSWAKKLYDDYDLSRFGYYKPSERAMLMNISTGSGTLVHEMTHALVRFDFPDIPSWFNEGLGSLYERCSLYDGKILGYVNWRLPDLKDAIEDDSYTNLKKLLNTSDDEFYGDNSGFNYAQARYLCMFLQEKGMLRAYYKAFRDNYVDDKTGRKTIEKIYGKDLTELEKDYLDWVSTLTYGD